MNIILISIDSLRADHVGCYGYHRNTTPHIDKLAKQGTIFKNCYAQSSHTPTSHASLFTGLYPSEHKVMDFFDRLDNDIDTIPTILKKEYGYYCSAYVNFKHLILTNRMDKDYDYVFCNESFKILKDNILTCLNHIKKPFYLFIHCGSIHHPYRVPEPFKDQFVQRKIQILKNLSFLFEDKTHSKLFNKIHHHKNPYILRKFFSEVYRKLNRSNKLIRKIYNQQINLNNEFIKYLISKYDCGVNYADYLLGIIFNKIKKLGLFKDTLIILTSDHGDEFYEHNFISHGRELYNTLIKVPLIIYYPKIKRKKINNKVMHIDMLPTILDLLNIKINHNVQGKNLFLINDNNRLIISEFYPLVAIQKNNYKLITSLLDKKGFTEKIKYIIHEILKNPKKVKYIPFKLNKILKKEELYDLKNDLYEQKNIINERLEIRNQLKKELDEWYRNLRKANIKSKKIKYEKKAKEQLRKLGYI